MDKLNTLPDYQPSKLQLDRIVADCVVPFWQFDMAPARELLEAHSISDLTGLRGHIAANPAFATQLGDAFVVPVINGAGLELLQADNLVQLNEVIYNEKILAYKSLHNTSIGNPLETELSSFGQSFDGIFEAAETGLERMAALVLVGMQGESRLELHIKGVGVRGEPVNLLLHCYLPANGDMVDIIGRDIAEEIAEHRRLDGQRKEKVDLVESFSDIVCTIDENAEIDYVSPSIETLLGWSPEEFIRMSRDPALSQNLADIKKILSDDLQLALDDPGFVADYRKRLKIDAVAKDGMIVTLSLGCSFLLDVDGPRGMMISARDTSDTTKLESDYRLAAKVFENSADGILLLNAEQEIVQANDAVCRITGFDVADLLGKFPGATVLRNGDNDLLDSEALSQSQLAGFWQGERRASRSNGEVFEAFITITRVSDEQGRLQAFICMLRDITQTKASEERIRHLAFFDGLTDLPNRTLFHDRLEHEIQRCERNKQAAALLFLDLDGFKAINDTLGHPAGDELLVQVADRLRHTVRGEDTVARMSGDEFTILISGQSGTDQVVLSASQVARKVQVRLNEPFQLGGHEVIISTSIGVALYPNNGVGSAELLRNADTAMYFAKQNGKNNFQFYSEDMNEHSMDQLAHQNSLYHAAAGNEFEVFYQPIICYTTGKIRSVESLLRWRKPSGELVEPEAFLPMAEQTGLVVRIGEWAIERACQQFAEWKTSGIDLEHISINLSPRQFMDDSLVYQLSHSMKHYNLQPHEVEIELAESTVMADVKASADRLAELRSLGVSIAIDDFGTGYSSLHYLKDLPISSIKIDQRFVQTLPGTLEDQQLIRVIMSLATGLGMHLIAEGVETVEQSAYLAELGCQSAQGFLFSKPVPAYELEQYLLNADASLAQILPHLSPAPAASMEEAWQQLVEDSSSSRSKKKRIRS